MNTSTEIINDKIAHLTEDAEAFFHAAQDSASKEAEEVSKRLADGCTRSKNLYRLVRAKGAEGGRAVDQELHAHSIRYLAIVAGLGAMLGFVIASKCRSCKPLINRS